MPANQPARAVHSNQPDLHPRLVEVVQRHRHSEFRRPIADHNRRAFDGVAARVAAHRGPLILDSFCGVGASSGWLAAAHPDALVIGVDKSAHRLARQSHHQPGWPSSPSTTGQPTAGAGAASRCLLVQAEVEDFWRLALTAGWRPLAHYLLYPNPWPKAEHLKRRVHGSPLLPTLLELGGALELRSNWPLYLREFAAALNLSGWQSRLEALAEPPGITPFERKYAAAGQELWRLQAWQSSAL